MKNSIFTACACACLLLPSAALCSDFDMTPGKWEFTSTVSMPMMGAPQVTIQTECITEEEAKRDPLADLVDDGNCTFLNKQVKGNTMSFEMQCTEQGMTMHGKGSISASGDTASGKMEMTMEMPEMPNLPNMPSGPLTTTTSWEGKRTGPCD